MSNLVFLESMRGMWSGASKLVIKNRIGKIVQSNMEIELVETNLKSKINISNDQQTTQPLRIMAGPVRGFLTELYLTEQAFRDQLRSTTKFGNIWLAFRYLANVLFFSTLIIASQGSNQKNTTATTITIFGVWTIFELSVNRGALSGYKSKGMIHRLGIPIKQLCLGNAITTWVELICLYGFLVSISLLNVINITITDYLFILPSAILLITLGIPYAAIISSYSINRSDARYILPILFRFLLFTIPIFDHFHNRFGLISSIIKFSPLNLPFNLLNSSRNVTQNEILIYSFFVLLGYISGVFLEKKTQKNLWKISNRKNSTSNKT